MFGNRFDAKRFFDVAQGSLDVAKEAHSRHEQGLCMRCGVSKVRPDEKICKGCFGKVEDVAARGLWGLLKHIADD